MSTQESQKHGNVYSLIYCCVPLLWRIATSS